MRAKIIITILLLLLLSLILISLNFFQSSIGPHGGKVKQAGVYNIEMRNTYPNIYTFLLDKSNKPIRNKGISCEIIFFLPNNTKINSPLKLFREDGFTMELGELNYTSYKILFNVFGKIISADFENENPIAQKIKTKI